ncbi:MAG: MaoC family dehydratase [Roseitalea sp.]|jgi:acyl dehydratase|nr:MaoC family dehydratase [Roseitalea sp.]MBO6720449.1 MaoC family dehydratase [Roseitalea sp.]MBO6742809.1 MaoC family dehydratase [Roseitalea sp.]
MNLIQPIDEQPHFFDDFAKGHVYRFGDEPVTEDAIIAFGRSFDMLPFHVDAEAAKRSVFGGLVASGWHTSALMMRMLVRHFLSPEGVLASPGIDTIRWTASVRPDDRLSMKLTIAKAEKSASKPDRGRVLFDIEILNQDQAIVMTATAITIYRTAPSSGR